MSPAAPGAEPACCGGSTHFRVSGRVPGTRAKLLVAVGSGEMFFLQIDARPSWCQKVQAMPQGLFATSSVQQQTH